MDEHLRSPCVKSTYDYFKVVAGDDGVSVLHPLDGGSRRAGHLALKHNVHGLVGVNVGRPFDKLGGNWGRKHRSRTMLSEKLQAGCCTPTPRDALIKAGSEVNTKPLKPMTEIKQVMRSVCNKRQNELNSITGRKLSFIETEWVHHTERLHIRENLLQ